jgi:hypothetical protein
LLIALSQTIGRWERASVASEEVEKLGMKLAELESHLQGIRVEAERIAEEILEPDREGSEQDEKKLKRLEESIRQSSERIDSKREQLLARRARLKEEIERALSPPPASETTLSSSWLENMIKALQRPRSATVIEHSGSAVELARRRARRRSWTRRGIALIPVAVLISIGAYLGGREIARRRVQAAELAAVKNAILEQQFLRRVLTPKQISRIHEATTREELADTFGDVVRDLETSAEAVNTLGAALNGHHAVTIEDAGGDRLVIALDPGADDSLRRAYGEDTRRGVELLPPPAARDQVTGSTAGKAITLPRALACMANTEMRIFVRLLLPLGLELGITSMNFPVAGIARAQEKCP